MTEFSTTPPKSVTHPTAAARPASAAKLSQRFQLLIADGKVVIRLDDNARLVMEPSAAIAIAAVIIEKAIEAAPGKFLGDQRAVLARILADATALDAARSPEAAPQVD